MTYNELDAIFADALNVKKPATRKPAPIDPLVKLQKALDRLTGPDNCCDLSKATAPSSQGKPYRVRVVKFDKDTRRAITRSDPLADENLGTTTARAVRKAEDEIDLYSGFVSKCQITREK